jgi:hypothetical protein
VDFKKCPGSQPLAHRCDRTRSSHECESEFDMNESPVLLHIWTVDPAQESALVKRLAELFDQVTDEPGFVSARILESADLTSVAAMVEMQSVEDRQRLEQLPEVRNTLDDLHGAFSLVARLYHEVGA